MQYKLKQVISNPGEDRIINENLKVINNVVYLEFEGLKFKHKNECWYQFTNKWIDLQGGIPDYTIEKLYDNIIIEEIKEEEIND